MRTTFIFTILAAFAAQLALAIPPACLLAAVNTQQNPANLSSVCNSTNAEVVQQYMASNCGGNANIAQQAFIATCSSAGTSVAAYTASSTASHSGSSTGTGTITSTAKSSGSASGSAGSTKSTAGANADYRNNFKPMAAAAVALVGAVAAL